MLHPDNEYQKVFKVLNRYYWKGIRKYDSDIFQDCIGALVDFLGGYAFERRGASPQYPRLAKETVKENGEELGASNEWGSDIEERIWESFKLKCIEEDVNKGAKFSPMAVSKDPKVSLIRFASDKQPSIAAWIEKEIRRCPRSAHRALVSIRGVGNKVASFYMRDIALKRDIHPIDEADRYLFQPVDVWTRRAAEVIAGEKELSDAQYGKHLERWEQKLDLKLGEGNIVFWILGAKILKDEELFTQFVREIIGRNERMIVHPNLQKRLLEIEDEGKMLIDFISALEMDQKGE